MPPTAGYTGDSTVSTGDGWPDRRIGSSKAGGVLDGQSALRRCVRDRISGRVAHVGVRRCQVCEMDVVEPGVAFDHDVDTAWRTHAAGRRTLRYSAGRTSATRMM